LTVHRRENHGARLMAVLAAIREISADAEIVVPLHPSPAVRAPIEAALQSVPGVHLLPPLEYPAFVWLMMQATLALTDSGGVQEEAPALGLPVLVLRDMTERREGISSGNARLVGTDTRTIVAAVRALLADRSALKRMGEATLPYGTGDASQRIADVLDAHFVAARAAAE
jgi:UDP-N-acetylglucosamine 2-epimerase (non-hydrolysing)